MEADNWRKILNRISFYPQVYTRSCQSETTVINLMQGSNRRLHYNHTHILHLCSFVGLVPSCISTGNIVHN